MSWTFSSCRLLGEKMNEYSWKLMRVEVVILFLWRVTKVIRANIVSTSLPLVLLSPFSNSIQRSHFFTHLIVSGSNVTNMWTSSLNYTDLLYVPLSSSFLSFPVLFFRRFSSVFFVSFEWNRRKIFTHTQPLCCGSIR